MAKEKEALRDHLSPGWRVKVTQCNIAPIMDIFLLINPKMMAQLGHCLLLTPLSISIFFIRLFFFKALTFPRLRISLLFGKQGPNPTKHPKQWAPNFVFENAMLTPRERSRIANWKGLEPTIPRVRAHNYVVYYFNTRF